MKHWKRALLALGLCGVTLPAWAGDPPGYEQSAGQEQSPAEKFKAARKTQADAQAAFDKLIAEYRKEGKRLSAQDPAYKAALDARTKASQALAAAATDIIKTEPQSSLGFEAITAAMTAGQPSPAAIKALADHHAANPKVGTLIARLGAVPPTADTKRLLMQVMEKNPSRDTKGNAAFTLASGIMRSNRNPSKDPAQVEKDNAEAEKLFERVAKEFSDVKMGTTSTLGERAASNLFEIRHLQIGKVAPDIVGEDTDGKKFKLSDYRGKVVMLDFWGHW